MAPQRCFSLQELLNCCPWQNLTGLLARPIIHHKDVGHGRAHELSKFLVVRVHEILVAVLVGLEGQNETVGEPFVMVLRADIGSPFEAGDLLDLAGKQPEGLDHLIDLDLGGGGFEFEGHHMDKFALADRLSCIRSVNDLHEGQRGEKRETGEHGFCDDGME